MGRSDRYAGDPLIEARKVHRPEYRGHPDGRCCVGCEGERDEMTSATPHTTWPCPAVDRRRCAYTFGEDDEPGGAYRCIQTKHRGRRHLVENHWGTRMVVWPVNR